MIRSIFFTPDAQLKTDLSQIDIAFALHEPKGVLWVDFEASTPDEDEPLLRKTFSFHPLAIDDALQEAHSPKLDNWGNYLYIVLHSVLYDYKEGDIDSLELDIFIGDHYIVTHHDKPIEAVSKVWEVVHRDPNTIRLGADHLLYLLSDEVVSSYMPAVEELDRSLDIIEDEIFSNPNPSTLARIFTVKRSVLFLRRMISPQREVMNKLARDDYQVIDEQDRVYFRDVYDHLFRLYDITEGVRDLVSGTMDTYLSVMNNRLNDVMKTLTIITTVFMPISFIASFFGMNFFQPAVPLGIWTGFPAFIITLLIILMTPLGMFLWMRRRGWM